MTRPGSRPQAARHELTRNRLAGLWYFPTVAPTRLDLYAEGLELLAHLANPNVEGLFIRRLVGLIAIERTSPNSAFVRPKNDGGSPASIRALFNARTSSRSVSFSASNRTAQFIDRFAADHRHQIKGRVMPAELGLEETYRGGQNFVNGHRCAPLAATSVLSTRTAFSSPYLPPSAQGKELQRGDVEPVSVMGDKRAGPARYPAPPRS